MAVAAAVRHFERAAARYGGFRNGWPLGALRRQEQAAVRSLALVRAGDRVLDAGCGDGDTLAWLTAAGAKPVGIDVARGMARACRRRGFAVCVQDFERLGLHAVFDWTLCIGALEFAARPASAIAGLAATLRPGGRLVLLFPRRTLLARLYAAYHRAHGVRIQLFSRDDIAAALHTAGLGRPVWRDCVLSSVCVAERAES